MVANVEEKQVAYPQERASTGTHVPEKKPLLSRLLPYLFIAPALAVFTVFLFIPFIRTIFLSLFLTNSVGEARVFRGLGNYIRLFTSVDYLTVMLHTVVFAAILIVGAMGLSFITSNLANMKGRAFRIFPILFTMPIAAAAGSFALLFEKMFDPTAGVINKMLHANIGWFQDPHLAMLSIGMISIWLLSGGNFLYMYAGLKNIPKDVLESAEIDGASGLAKLFRVTVPCMSPMLFFILVTDIIASFQVFTQINVITQGGPGNETNVMVYGIYRDAFFNFRFGPAAAESVVLFLIILGATLLQFRNEKRMVHYN